MANSAFEEEAARVAAVRSYQITGTAPEPDYDELAQVAAQTCGCPAGLINILDDASLYSKSRYGIPYSGEPLPRELFMCSTAAIGSDILEVPDCAADERFAHLPVVKHDPHVRFYAGMPLVNSDGYHLGSLCILDFKTHEPLTLEQRDALRTLARHVVTLLELRRTLFELERARQEAAAEREKSERLLRCMLPDSVAQELKENQRVAPRFFDSASILFTDFEAFTRHAERTEPKALVEQLNEFFSMLDQIARRHGLEMLKTIGDAYMCVGGVPEPRRSHPVDACLAALEMQGEMDAANRRRDRFRLPRWDIRIGIHSGAVIAGVVGQRRFTYDIWGDAVNVAARMEGAGAAARINVSETVYHRTRTLFDFEPRGSIEVKNKGALEMFYLTGIKRELAEDEARRQPNAVFNIECARLFPRRPGAR